MKQRTRDIACALTTGAALAATAFGGLVTVGVRQYAFLADSGMSGLIIAGATLAVFAMMSALAYALLRNAGRLIAWADSKEPLRRLHLRRNGRDIAIAAAIIFICWLPYIIVQYPCSMNGDTYNQLYQFQTSAPTLYTTMGITVPESFVDHHPVFDTLVFGWFLSLGDALGSQNLGLFAYSLAQCALTATALGASCCYLERLGVPKLFRLVSLAFCALYPVIPLWATCMIKDSLNACMFVFFSLLVVEAVQTRGQSLKRARTLVLYIVVACLCILTKKSGALVVGASSLALLIYARKAWAQALAGLVAPLAVCFALVPALVYPAIGGVAAGGSQEAFGFALQQVVTVALYDNDLGDDELAAIDEVMDLERAEEKYQPGLVDPVKNSTRAGVTARDFVAFLPTYFAIGARHADEYTASIFNVAATLVCPGRTFTFNFTPEQEDAWKARFAAADEHGELHLTFDKPEPFKTASTWLDATWRTVIPKLGPLQLFFNPGFFGGWIPIICLIICLFRDKRQAVALVPVIAAVGIVVLSPASSVRYVLPMLYTTPLMLGLACAALRAAGPGACPGASSSADPEVHGTPVARDASPTMEAGAES